MSGTTLLDGDSGSNHCIRCDVPFTTADAGAELCPSCAAGSSPRPVATAIETLLDRPSVQEAEASLMWNIGDTILDTYEVTGVLGEGGMGKVYRVHHRGWNMDLAVKRPLPEVVAAAGGVSSFVAEAEAWVGLGLHPHIVSCYYVRDLGGIPCVFAELVEGGSLADWIQRRSFESLSQMLDVTIQFAWGLHHAHEQQLVHQDVKPANVMMTRDGIAKVTDFGLARARGGAAAATGIREGGTILVHGAGMTPAYCSPEQAAHEPLSRRTDLWSWGLSILEMFAGRAFWVLPEEPRATVGQLAAEALEHYLEESLEDSSLPRMPMRLGDLLRQCFQRNPESRPRNMLAVAEELKEIFEDVAGGAYLRPMPQAAELLADGLNNKALSLHDLGREDEAARLFDEALRAEVGHPEATYNRGLLLWRSGRMTDDVLIRELEEVKKARLDKWQPGYFLSLVHVERGDAESARMEMEALPEIALNDQQVKSAYRTAKETSGGWARYEKTFGGHQGGDINVAISPDGRFGYSGCGDTFAHDSEIHVLDLRTGTCARTLSGHRHAVTALSVSGDGRYLLSGSRETMHLGPTAVRLWDLQTGLCIRTFEGHEQSVNCVAIARDGRHGLSGGRDRNLYHWDLTTGNRLCKYTGHSDEVRSTSLALDGRVAVSTDLMGNLVVWDLTDRRSIRCISWKEQACLGAISSDGRSAFATTSAGYNEIAKLFLLDLTTGETIRTFNGHTAGRINAVALSEDGRYGLSCTDSETRWWDMATGRCLRTFNAPGHSLALSQDGHTALSGSEKKVLYWSLHVEHAVPYMPVRPRDAMEQIRFAQKFEALLEKASHETDLGAAAIAVREARRMPGFEHSDRALDVWYKIGRGALRSGFQSGWQLRRLDGHIGPVRSVAVLSDCRHALSGGGDSKVRMWDLHSGACLWTYEGHKRAVNTIAISPDGAFGFSASGEDFYADDSAIRKLDLSKGTCVGAFVGHTGQVSSIAISADGSRLFTGGSDWTLRLWDALTGRCIRTIGALTEKVSAVALTSDARYGLSSSGTSGIIRLWNLETGACEKTFKGHEKAVTSLVFSVDSRSALSASYDGAIRIWDVCDGSCAKAFEGHAASGVNSVAIARDGRHALSTGGMAMRLWDLPAAACLRSFEVHGQPLLCAALSDDGRFALCGGSAGGLWQWELDWDFDFSQSAREIQLTNSKTHAAASATRSGKDQFKNLMTDAESALAGGEPAKAAALVEMARMIPGCEESPLAMNLWRRSGQKGKRKSLRGAWLSKSMRDHAGAVTSVAISPDGRYGLTGGEDGCVRYWDLQCGKCLNTAAGHTNGVRSVAFLPDGRHGVSAGDLSVRIWDFAQNIGIKTLKGHDGIVCCVAVSPDGRTAISGDSKAIIRLWDIASGKCMKVLKGHERAVSCAAITPDGRLAVTGSHDQTLRIWDLSTGQCGRVSGRDARFTSEISSVSISPDSRHALYGTQDSIGYGLTIWLWKITATEKPVSFRWHPSGREVMSTAFTPDGLFGITAGSDGTVRFLQLPGGACLLTIQSGKGSVGSIAVSPDGDSIFSGCSDGSVDLWELDWDYDFPEPKDWDDAALLTLSEFLAHHTPRPKGIFRRSGPPEWTEQDFQELIVDLSRRGYGWLRPEGVLRKLKEMAGA